MNKFRNGNVSYLVATDVASRGLDISNLDFIVNYDVPQNSDDYIHRIGRTARAGKSGFAFTLVTPQDEYAFGNIKKTRTKIIEKDVPTDEEIEEIKTKSIMQKVEKSLKDDDLEKYIKIIKSSSSKDLSSEEIAAGLLKMVREK